VIHHKKGSNKGADNNAEAWDNMALPPGKAHEKGARQRLTRPEPTINGNCDSWGFILGKKRGSQRQPHRATSLLPGDNAYLSTG